MHVYSLTHLTGRRRNADRTLVVATVEVNRFTFLVIIASIAASVLPALLVGLLLGPLAVGALAVPFLFILAGLTLVDQRTRKGLQLRRYEAMWDRRKAKNVIGQVFVCGQPIPTPTVHILVQTVIPIPGAAQHDVDIFDGAARQDAPVVVGASRPRQHRRESFLE